MQIHCVGKSAQRPPADVVIIPVWKAKKKAEIACAEKEYLESVKFPLECGDFLGNPGETLLLYLDKKAEKRALLLGLGPQKECSEEVLRRAYAKALKALKEKKIKSATLFLPVLQSLTQESAFQAILEGLLLADYTFEKLKSESLNEEKKGVVSLCICAVGAKQKAAVQRTEKIISAVNFVRDLVNCNSDDKQAAILEKIAKGLEKKSPKIKTHILDKKALENLDMGLLLAVGRAGAQGPSLVVMEYKGNPKSKDTTAIIGKGITFDTGGLNLKMTGQIETMKCDMAGAATTLGIIQAAADLGLSCNLLGVLAIAENAIGPTSYKPGDVYRSYSGKTVEISNTDAEGRLVLADALSYVQEKYKPSRIIDLATLTGGIVVALGEMATGLFSNDTALVRDLEKAAIRTDERLWRMPLYPEYKEMLKSSIADIKNSGGKMASSCTAALFLQQFIKNTPWAHLDIAGTAYLSDLNLHPYQTTPGSGVCVRLIIDYLENL